MGYLKLNSFLLKKIFLNTVQFSQVMLPIVKRRKKFLRKLVNAQNKDKFLLWKRLQAKLIQFGLTNPDKNWIRPIKAVLIYIRRSSFPAGGSKFEQNKIWYIKIIR